MNQPTDHLEVRASPRQRVKFECWSFTKCVIFHTQVTQTFRAAWERNRVTSKHKRAWYYALGTEVKGIVPWTTKELHQFYVWDWFKSMVRVFVQENSRARCPSLFQRCLGTRVVAPLWQAPKNKEGPRALPFSIVKDLPWFSGDVSFHCGRFLPFQKILAEFLSLTMISKIHYKL